ncbi:MAM domain protein [Oesophagostomum dentatum]|uniref:MAM domain protein n=1 Tax=Oesophagostomum dentatum TaxID=61180 RepID=A0A0B1TC53_OESDE|nr:MAM domain protein [Oesophagostomum dentatum]
MSAPFAFLFVLVARVHSEITSSADLNCDFSINCQWRNASGSEDNGDWRPGTFFEADPLHMITPRKGSEGYFAYTSGGLMGRTVALLVSDVASCQIGGGNIKYWYYKTGIDSQLEVCTRQPPGSKEPSSFKCYDGLSPNFAQQWIFRVVELPPLSQPFELVFRGTFYPPMDVIALTDIVYSSALCDAHYQRTRKKRLMPSLIGIHDWQKYRQSATYKGETMIIVSQDADDKETSKTTEVKQENGTVTTDVPKEEFHENQPSSSTTPTTTTSTTLPSKTTVQQENESSTALPTVPTTDAVANFVKLLRETAPVLPYIPVLVKSLQSVDLLGPSATEPLFPLSSLPNLPSLPTVSELRRSPVEASHFYNTEANYSETMTTSEPSLIELAKRFGILGEDEALTTVQPMLFTPAPEIPTLPTLRNIYGMQATTAKSELASTLYPPSLVKNAAVKRKIPVLKSKAEDTKQQSNEELRKLHSKLFKKSDTPKETAATTTTKVPELLVFKKPTQVESELATKLTELSKYLPTSATSDLKMLREIPDLEGLTRGMDLSLVSKPGGFAKLKRQFVNRLMRRTMGLPFDDSSGSALPPPIIPVKVTRKMMRESVVVDELKSRTMEQIKELVGRSARKRLVRSSSNLAKETVTIPYLVYPLFSCSLLQQNFQQPYRGCHITSRQKAGGERGETRHSVQWIAESKILHGYWQPIANEFPG